VTVGRDAALLMYGWSGRDYVSGGGGADRCLAVLDGDGEDTVLGGRGYGTCAADAGDSRRSVERRRVCKGESPNPRTRARRG